MAVSKRTGRKSVVANDFLIPLPPGPPTANDVGTNRPFDNGSAVVDFSPVELAVSYKVYAAASGQTTVTNTGTSSPIILTGLKTNVFYTFTVTGFNSEGVEGDPSNPSNPTLITTVPATPLAPVASSPNANQDVVSWTAPATGGKTITGYIWNSTDGKTNLPGGTPGGGATSGTTVTVTVAQEPATAQKYSVYAINANGNSLLSPESNLVTTTFSFAPFRAFGFSPFVAFGFSPFMAFGFSPFMAFGFSPFMAFAFSPFMAFSFTPCIASNTKLATITKKGKLKWVKAKNIKTGTKVYSPTWDEFKSEEIESPYESTVQYDALTNLRMETGEIVYIKPRPVEKTIVINNNTKKRFSSTQPLLIVKKSDPKKHSWVFAGDVKPGDFLWEYDFDERRFKKIIVKSVKVSNKKDTVYAFDVQGFDTFISGNIVCHNLMKV